MKTLMTIIFAMLLAGGAVAQAGKAEQEVRKFAEDFDRAQMARDVAWLERVLADDYTFSGPQADVEDRAKAIAWLRDQKTKPTYKLVSVRSEDVKVKMVGDRNAILTGTWVGTTAPFSGAKAEHTDRGRFTSFLEKRNGQWMILAEHVSEAPHDRKLMEQEVMKASDAYTEVIKKRDKAGFEHMLFDTYTYTNERGDVRNKAQDIAHSTSGDTTIESMAVSDRSIRVLSNGSAVETGKFNIKGSNKGKAFDETGRYTTTWVWRDGRWQVAADHTSNIPTS